MRRIAFFFFLCMAQGVYSQMILEYNMPAPNQSVTLSFGTLVNLTVNWGDTTSQTITTVGDVTHTYTTAGIKSVSISGTLRKFGSNTNSTGNRFLTKVVSWGNLGLTNLDYAFYNATSLGFVPDSIPRQVGLTRYMFFGATNFNSPIGNWNTSNIFNMNAMFGNATSFNQNIGNWNMSNVQDISYMFYNAQVFNQPIGNWDVSKVTSMNFTFYNAKSFNQPLGNWNTQSVTGMYSLFGNAEKFDQNIGNWNTSNVTNMGFLFGGALKFNQNISGWNTANATDMNSMFNNAPLFNQNIRTWNTGNVRDMSHMFANASAFNRNLGNWNIANVTTAGSMFYNAKLCYATYDSILIGWSTQNVKSGVAFDAGNSKYSDASNTARDVLKNSKGWTITDKGYYFGVTRTSECDGYLWFGPNGTFVNYTNSGAYYHHDCFRRDSLYLEIKNSKNDTVNVSSCTDYNSPGGYNYTTSGTFTEYYTATNGCDSTATLNLTISGCTITSLTQTKEETEFQVKLSNDRTITISSPTGENQTFYIISMDGKIVYQGKEKWIDISNLGPGLYIFQSKNAETVGVRKLLLQ